MMVASTEEVKMKISKRQLRRIIREEHRRVLREEEEKLSDEEQVEHLEKTIHAMEFSAADGEAFAQWGRDYVFYPQPAFEESMLGDKDLEAYKAAKARLKELGG
jgi:hypothetical protein